MSTASRCDPALPVSAVRNRAVTTIEGIGASPAGAKIQKAWLDLEVIQCGYCQSGLIMSATALLANTPNPDDSDIDAAMAENICYSGKYARIRAAIKRAASGRQSEEQAMLAKESMGATRIADRRSGGRVSARVSSAGARGQRAGAAARYNRRQIRAPDAFIRINPTGQTTLVMPQVEMGQGIYTGVATPVATCCHLL